MSGERPALRNLSAEPPYPRHHTVLMSMRDPNLTAHLATALCNIEHPHLVSECGEWINTERSESDG